jgi:hypothetical protein
VPAAACDALRTRQGAAKAALLDPLPMRSSAAELLTKTLLCESELSFSLN